METDGVKPLTIQEIAATLRKWGDVLQIPSGDFVNEDLRLAAARLESLSQVTEAEVEAGAKAMRAAFCSRISGGNTRTDWDMLHPGARADYLDEARAALEAARKART